MPIGGTPANREVLQFSARVRYVHRLLQLYLRSLHFKVVLNALPFPSPALAAPCSRVRGRAAAPTNHAMLPSFEACMTFFPSSFLPRAAVFEDVPPLQQIMPPTQDGSATVTFDQPGVYW